MVLPVIVDATSVDVVRDDPLSVEKAVSDSPGTLMEDAFSVETVRVLFTNMVFEVRVEIAMVEAMREDPVRVENALSDNPGTLMVDAFRVETVSVDVTVTLFVEIMDPTSVL